MRPGPRLRIPKLLAVSVLGIVAGCPGDDAGDTGTDSGPSATTSESTTTADEPTGTTAGTTDTGVADSTTGPGELPDCQGEAMDEPACEAITSCVWRPELGGCIIDCPILEDLSAGAEAPKVEPRKGRSNNARGVPRVLPGLRRA